MIKLTFAKVQCHSNMIHRVVINVTDGTLQNITMKTMNAAI